MNSLFEDAIRTGSPVGAYLVEGSAGNVSMQIEWFIERLFCINHSGCHECSSCIKLLADVHPDVFRIKGNGSIKVADVEEVPGWIARKSFEGGYKAVVIKDAHTMIEAAQNKLLKSIEEPPDRSIFLIGVDNRKNILPTILSRCIIIRMPAQDREESMDKLKEKLNLSTMNATVLLRTADWDAYAAADLAERKYLDTREDALRIVKRLLFAKNMAISVMMDILLKYTDNLDDIFLAMETYIRDILIFKNTNDENLLRNNDKIVDVMESASALSDKKLVNTLQQLQETDTKRKICTGILKKLLLEDMLFKILEVVLT